MSPRGNSPVRQAPVKQTDEESVIMKSAWIVVADASRARFFSAELPASPLCEIETLSNPEARLHEGDLISDRGGRDRDSGGSSHGGLSAAGGLAVHQYQFRR